MGMLDVSSPAHVNAKIAELKRHEERDLLLPETFKKSCVIDPEISRTLIRDLFLYPYRRRAVHLESMIRPLCDYIEGHYRLSVPPSAEGFGYGLWEPTARQ